MTPAHDPGALAAHALNGLDEQEAAAVEQHVADCAACRTELAELREATAALNGFPPEALIDGPPSDGDLVLQRTLRQVRAESKARDHQRHAAAVAAAAVALVAAGGFGAFVGQGVEPEPVPGRAAPVSGARTLSATDAGTGANMAVTITPAAGWIRLSADVSGIPAGERCRLVVIGRDGSRTVAGGWLVSPEGEQAGTELDGSAPIGDAEVTAVAVENEQGRQFVTVPV